MYATSLEIALVTLLTMMGLAGWIANILGMPGSWVTVSLAGLCLWLRPDSVVSHVGWAPMIGMVIAAGLGELLEFAAGALGVNRLGGSARGSVLAIGGSVAGAITGLFFGNVIPIPIVGPLVASLILGACGAFGGALAGEKWAGKDWDSSIEIGTAAFWGRLLGTVGKAVCGTIVCVIFLVAIWF